MNKKNYTTPALSVEEFELNEVICTSIFGIESDEVQYGGSSVNDNNNNPSARSRSRRGIWDED